MKFPLRHLMDAPNPTHKELDSTSLNPTSPSMFFFKPFTLTGNLEVTPNHPLWVFVSQISPEIHLNLCLLLPHGHYYWPVTLTFTVHLTHSHLPCWTQNISFCPLHPKPAQVLHGHQGEDQSSQHGGPLASAASLPASLSCEWPCSFSLTLEGAIGFGTSFLSLDSAHSTSFYNTWHRCSIFWEDFPPSPLLLLCFHKALHISHFFPLSIFKHWLCMKMPSHLNSYMSFNTHNNPARQAPSSSPCY